MTDPFVRLDAQPLRFEDERGWLEVLYESDRAVLKRSFSKQNVFRGLHFQPGPQRQSKLIRVIEGRILDFVAEVEDGTNRLHHTVLEPRDGWIFIAADLAHGFYALEDTLFEYVCDGPYDEGGEQAFSILESLAALGLENPIMSRKDREAIPLRIPA